jgi:hypothetical protein
MSRFGRVVANIVALVAALATALVVFPGGAIGGESDGRRSSQRQSQYFFDRNATIESDVDGDVQIIGGKVRVPHTIHGNLYILLGDAALEVGGRVDGDVITLGGRFRGDPHYVGGHVYAPGSTPGAFGAMAESSGFIGAGTHPFSPIALAFKISILFLWMIVALVLTLLTGRDVRTSSSELRISPFHTFALGLTAYLSFVITAIVFSYLVPYLIGIPLLAALGIFAVMTKVYGMVAVFHAIGTMVARPREREQFDRRRLLRGDLTMVLIGLLLLGAVRLIPVIGTVAWMAASLFGVGVALGTKFGRREPWFLTWRPVAS